MDYVDMMKVHQRFCEARYKAAEENEYAYECYKCPLENNTVCSSCACGYTPEDAEEAAKILEEWAKENPEPKYPTWGGWFVGRGDLIERWFHAYNARFIAYNLSAVMNKQIPDAIAD